MWAALVAGLFWENNWKPVSVARVEGQDGAEEVLGVLSISTEGVKVEEDDAVGGGCRFGV